MQVVVSQPLSSLNEKGVSAAQIIGRPTSMPTSGALGLGTFQEGSACRVAYLLLPAAHQQPREVAQPQFQERAPTGPCQVRARAPAQPEEGPRQQRAERGAFPRGSGPRAAVPRLQ